MKRVAVTLGLIASLGGIASAEVEELAGHVPAVQGSASRRGVAQDYVVLPSGSELTAQMRFVTADPMLGAEPLKITDLGLFDLAGRIAITPWLEASGGVTMLAKQPSYTSEKPWQHASLALRARFAKNVAFALAGNAGHLLDSTGAFTRSAAMMEVRKPITDILSYTITTGVDAITLSKSGERGAFIGEVAGTAAAYVRMPNGMWGAWLGIGYAIPLVKQGNDPTTMMGVDPQPRLDLRLGNVWSVTREWDLFAELVIVDRGDVQDATTRLPILDGGFDQKHLILGVTRHFETPRRRAPDLQLAE